MTVKDSLKRTLESLRSFNESLLQSFTDAKDWTYRVHPTANHALWIVGHVGHVDNLILGMLGSPRAIVDRELDALFAPGSEPHDNAAGYPPPERFLAYLRDRRTQVLAFLDEQTDESLAKAAPPGSPPIFSDVGSVFAMISFHEAMHFGQLTVVRQALKHPRIL